MNIAWGEKSVNKERLEHAMKRMHPDTDILVLPETFSTGFPTGSDIDDVKVYAETEGDSEMVSYLKDISSRYNVAITGSIIINKESKLFNRFLFIEPSGEITYSDKRHLFRMGGEDKLFEPGRERIKVRFRGWNIAAVVCYDLRFPVWCRNVNNEYDLLIVVANWPTVRSDVWQTLLKARALENLSYVCGVNCIGEDFQGNIYNGESMVFDFKGKDVSVRPSDTNLLYAVLNKEKLINFRNKFPAWQDADNFLLSK